MPPTFWVVFIGLCIFLAALLLFVRQLEKNEPLRQATIRAKRSAPTTVTPSLPVTRTSVDMPPARRRSPRSTPR